MLAAIMASLEDAVENTRLDSAPLESSALGQLLHEMRSIIDASLAGTRGDSAQQEASLSTVNNATHAGAPNALSPAPNEGGSGLQMDQQHDGFDIAEVHSHTISPVSGALLTPSSSPSSPSEHHTDPTASSSSSSRPTAIPEGGIDIPLPILLLWLERNVSSAFFTELISRSFLLPNSDNEWTIQLLLETAVRHGVDDVHEFVERVCRGATELWELGYFVSAPTE
jgi:hypothetical protein